MLFCVNNVWLFFMPNFKKEVLTIYQNKKSNGNFFILPNDIFNERMNPRDFIVYSYLKRCADSKQQCFPSIKNIAKNCCISSVTATTAIKNLSDNGYIDIAHRYDGKGQLSNLYTVLKI